MSWELKSLRVKEVELADAIEISCNALASAKDQIEREREMITRANLLLYQVESVCVAETTQLE